MAASELISESEDVARQLAARGVRSEEWRPQGCRRAQRARGGDVCLVLALGAEGASPSAAASNCDHASPNTRAGPRTTSLPRVAPRLPLLRPGSRKSTTSRSRGRSRSRLRIRAPPRGRLPPRMRRLAVPQHQVMPRVLLVAVGALVAHPRVRAAHVPLELERPAEGDARADVWAAFPRAFVLPRTDRQGISLHLFFAVGV